MVLEEPFIKSVVINYSYEALEVSKQGMMNMNIINKCLINYAYVGSSMHFPTHVATQSKWNNT